MPNNMAPGPAPEGMKWCPKCKPNGKFVDKSNFQKDSRAKDGLLYECKVCTNQRQRHYRKSRKNRAKGRRYVPQHTVSRSLKLGLRDYTAYGPPPGINESLKYACMTIGFRMKPPPNGQTKGQAYCLNCTAGRCVHGGAVGDRQKRIRRRLKREKPWLEYIT